jgi:hypothetical protein
MIRPERAIKAGGGFRLSASGNRLNVWAARNSAALHQAAKIRSSF